jgi:hypothetical protein
VAATTRTSTATLRALPTGRTSPSCSTRSSLTCSASGMSPISSRKIVPPSAAWNSPLCACTAPVNAPRACPNSSDSSSGSGIAPQFTATNARSRRGLARWIARASSSLPVPDSPKMRTLASESATRLAWRSRSSIVGLRVMMPARHSAADSSLAWGRSPASFSADATSCSSSWLSKGLVRNPNTPRCVADTASGMVPCAVRMMTGSAGCCRCTASKSCRPSMPGIRRSVISTPGRTTASAASAVSPLSAVRTR